MNHPDQKVALPLRLIIVTQDEPFYLPRYLANTLKALPQGIEVVGVYALPAHLPGKGFLQTVIYYLGYFGPVVFCYLVTLRILYLFQDTLWRWRSSTPPRSIKGACRRWQIGFEKIDDINSATTIAKFHRDRPDLILSLACPQRIHKTVLELPPLGCLNIHSSLLPRLRGIYAGFWAMQQGESHSGVTIHEMNEGLDDGAIIAQQKITLKDSMSLHDLNTEVSTAGAALIAKALRQYRDGSVQRQPNPAAAGSYFSFPTKADVKIFRARKRRFFRYL